MQIVIQYTLQNDPKMHGFLKENSQWYKELNRNSKNYELFVKKMKKKYRLNPTDKISDTIDNIDMVSTIIKTIT